MTNHSKKFVIGEFIVMTDQFAPMGIPRVFNGQTFFVEDITVETIEGVECDVLKVNNEYRKNLNGILTEFLL